MIRCDYVSNSSSSSFIFDNNVIFDGFNITKEIMERFLKDVHFGTQKIALFDLQDKEDKKKCLEEYGDLSSQWDANCFNRIQNMNKVDWEGFKRAMEHMYEYSEKDKPRYCLYVLNIPKKYMSSFQKKEYAKIPEYVKQVWKDIRERYGIRTMLDVLKDKDSKFYIHFGENDVCNIDGMYAGTVKEVQEQKNYRDDYDKLLLESKTNNFKTESYTAQRFVEILIRWLVDHKIIDLKCPNYLEYFRVPEDHWWKHDEKHKGMKYFTINGKNITVMDVVDDVLQGLNCVMHEG